VPDAARYLASIMEEDVTEADVLRLVLDGHLRLSVRFVGSPAAKRYDLPTKKALQALHDSLGTRAAELQAAKAAGLPRPELKKRRPTPDDERRQEEEKVFTLPDETYDLPLLGGERLDIELQYQRLSGGPRVELMTLDGTFVDMENGTRLQLQEQFDKPHRDAAAPYYSPRNFFPARGLPADSVLVVRTAALHEFETRVLADLVAPVADELAKSVGRRERTSLLAIIAALADAAEVDVSKVSKAGKTIEAMTVRKGAKVAARTVEDFLRLIPDAVERRGRTST
jgi:hypothetical protein